MAPKRKETAKRSNEILEVEDEQGRQRRIESLLASRSNIPSRSSATEALPSLRPLDELRAFPLPPPTDLLSRLEAFLPAMKKANEELAAKVAIDPSSVDIENLDDESSDSEEDSDSGSDSDSDDDSDGNASDDRDVEATRSQKPYIEMHLGLGVFEPQGQNSRRAEDGEEGDSETQSGNSLQSSSNAKRAGICDNKGSPDVEMETISGPSVPKAPSHKLVPIPTSNPEADMIRLLQGNVSAPSPTTGRPSIIVLPDKP